MKTKNFEKDMQQIVDILQARGITTAVIGMGGKDFGPQQVLFGETDKMLILCASIMRRISDLTGVSYEETADAAKNILMYVTARSKSDNNLES